VACFTSTSEPHERLYAPYGVALVLTSRPYGRSVHGQVTARPGRGVAKFDDTYSADPANLGRVNQPTLLDALQEILIGCQQLLARKGLLVLTARPYRHRDRLVHLPRAA
jgi:modification methylase